MADEAQKGTGWALIILALLFLLWLLRNGNLFLHTEQVSATVGGVPVGTNTTMGCC